MPQRSLPFDWPLFGAALFITRHARGMTQGDVVAAVPGISKGTLSRTENGTECGVPIFLALCRWADINPFEAGVADAETRDAIMVRAAALRNTRQAA